MVLLAHKNKIKEVSWTVTRVAPVVCMGGCAHIHAHTALPHVAAVPCQACNKVEPTLLLEVVVVVHALLDFRLKHPRRDTMTGA